MIGLLAMGGYIQMVLMPLLGQITYWIAFLVPALLVHRWRLRRRSQILVDSEVELPKLTEANGARTRQGDRALVWPSVLSSVFRAKKNCASLEVGTALHSVFSIRILKTLMS